MFQTAKGHFAAFAFYELVLFLKIVTGDVSAVVSVQTENDESSSSQRNPHGVSHPRPEPAVQLQDGNFDSAVPSCRLDKAKGPADVLQHDVAVNRALSAVEPHLKELGRLLDESKSRGLRIDDGTKRKMAATFAPVKNHLA
jgi:hypothetical protein